MSGSETDQVGCFPKIYKIELITASRINNPIAKVLEFVGFCHQADYGIIVHFISNESSLVLG